MITILLEKIRAQLEALKSNIENIKPSSDYSLTEQKIGTDIDGRDIFMKTIYDDTQLVMSSSRSYTIDNDVNTEVIGIDTRNTWFLRSGTTTRTFMNSFFTNDYKYASTITATPGAVVVRSGSFAIDEITVTVIYKKVVTP